MNTSFRDLEPIHSELGNFSLCRALFRRRDWDLSPAL
jgi:hypothetical protein